MKNGLPINPVVYKMVVLVTCFMLVMLYNKSKAGVQMNVSQNDFAIQHHSSFDNGF